MYAIYRDCCTSGQCDTCSKMGRGTRKRVLHSRTDDRSEAYECAANWQAYRACVVEEGRAPEALSGLMRLSR